MPNYSPGHPPMNLLKIGDKWINRDHIVAVLPGHIPGINDTATKTLHVKLSGGESCVLRGDEEVGAMLGYLHAMDYEESGSVMCLTPQKEGAKLAPVPPLAVPEADASAMLAEANAAYATLRRDPEGWAGEVAERETWDGTLADGLDEADRAAGPEADPGPQGRRYFL